MSNILEFLIWKEKVGRLDEILGQRKREGEYQESSVGLPFLAAGMPRPVHMGEECLVCYVFLSPL